MDTVATVMCVVALVWVVMVVSFAIYFWLRIMPVIRMMQETTEGQLALSKLMFPPRFRR
jgi:hypothetical protein